MKKYFINPELKISSSILIISMMFFCTVTGLILKVHHDRLKQDYIKSLGAVTARIIDRNPELESEIIPLVTREVSEDEGEKGAELLKSYGMTENLKDSLFPYINHTITRNNATIFTVFAVMTGVLFLLNYCQFSFFYNRIRRITLGARKVVEGNFDITINENREGDFSKLAVSFNSMREVIRGNILQLNKEKQFLVDLLSDISHQLKTPLASLILYNDIMINKDLSLEQREKFLQSNQNQLSKMQWLIHSILKLAKLDAKAIELQRERQSMNETLQEAIESLESKASEGRVSIHINQTIGHEIIFEHDPLWLQEAFINIIKNGIEHTAPGGEVCIQLLENPVYRRVIIEDNGEGINEEDMPNIFKRFYKAKTSRKSESIGIGLALAKAIVEAHNGIIEVHSVLGEGTRFIVTFLKY